MIEKKEFYFLRHGEGEHQLGNPDNVDAALTMRGREQAIALQDLMQGLGIETVCHSPIRRAVETMELVTDGMDIKRVEIEELGECSPRVWLRMTKLGCHSGCEIVGAFAERTLKGVNEALTHLGPVLIVAHGGIHYAMSSFMEIEDLSLIGNCVPIHCKWEDAKWKQVDLSFKK